MTDIPRSFCCNCENHLHLAAAAEPRAFPVECRQSIQIYIDWSNWTAPWEDRSLFSGGLQNAWDAWAKAIDVRGVLTNVKSNATAVVKFVPSDGKSGNLPINTWASSSVANGTCSLQPGQAYSNSVEWTRENSRKIGMHEVGHFLGIRDHLFGPGPAIMSAWPSVNELTEIDIEAAVSLGYNRRNAPPPSEEKVLTNEELTKAIHEIGIGLKILGIDSERIASKLEALLK